MKDKITMKILQDEFLKRMKERIDSDEILKVTIEKQTGGMSCACLYYHDEKAKKEREFLEDLKKKKSILEAIKQ